MALLRPMEYFISPEHKEFDVFTPNFTDSNDDLFDQFVMMDSFESSDDSADQRIDIAFEAPTTSDTSDPAGTSPNPGWDIRHTESQEPWRTTLWPSNQGAALSSTARQGNQSPVYQVSAGRATISDSELHSLEGFSKPRIQTTFPPTPSPSAPAPVSPRKTSRTLFKTPQKSWRKLGDRKNTGQKNNPSSMIMSAPRYSCDMSGIPDSQTQRSQMSAFKSNVHTSSHYLPLSPPPSAKVADFDYRDQIIVSNQSQPESLQWQIYDGVSSNEQTYSNAADVELSSPFIHTPRHSKQYSYQYSSASSCDINYPSTPYRHEALNAIETPPSTQPLDVSGAFDFDFKLSTDLQSTPAQPWWCDNVSACTSQPSSSTYQHAASPSETDASQSLMQLTLDSTNSSLATQGLMINCGDQHSNNISEFNDAVTQGYSERTGFGACSSNRAISKYTQSGSASRSHRRHRSSTSRSPSLSPTSQPRRISRTPRTPTTPSHHRRKSSSTTPTSASIAGGFVNFTPHDSQKILGGVAPSGSSKTKARREKEAEIKRRKLSEAAVRAIKEAGGDVGEIESVLGDC